MELNWNGTDHFTSISLTGRPQWWSESPRISVDSEPMSSNSQKACYFLFYNTTPYHSRWRRLGKFFFILKHNMCQSSKVKCLLPIRFCPHIPIWFFYLHIYLCVCVLWIYVHHIHARVLGKSEEDCGLRELELNVITSYQVGAGNQMCVFYKSSKCS